MRSCRAEQVHDSRPGFSTVRLFAPRYPEYHDSTPTVIADVRPQMPLRAALPTALPTLSIRAMLSATILTGLIVGCGAPTPSSLPAGKAGAIETATPYARPLEPVIVTSAGAAVASSGGATAASTPSPSKETTYTVEANDTLLAIASRFDTTVEALVRRNNLTNAATLRIGQELAIPGGATVIATATPAATRTATPSTSGAATPSTPAATARPATATPTTPVTPVPATPPAASGAPAGSQIYVVVEGDIANAIAFKFGITLDQLAQTNNRTPVSLVALRIGERLIIPPPR